MLGESLVVLAGYLVGTFPSAALAGQATGHDPSAEGSGNPGATNVYRTSGRAAGVVVLFVDVAKGALAAGVGQALGGHDLGLAAGAAAVVGHVFPAPRRFRGGKGVATGSGMTAVLYPVLSLGLGAAFVAVVALTRRISVGSLILVLLLPIGVALGGNAGFEVLVTAGLSLVVIVRHHENIRRLIRREEAPLRLILSREAPEP